MEKADIVLLSDEDLFAKLKEVGLVSGPIADSTRALYQDMLYKHLKGEQVFVLDSSPEKIASEEFIIKGEESPLVKNERSRRSMSKTPSVYMEGTPPPQPVRRSQRKTVASVVPSIQEVIKEEEVVLETTKSNIQRRHTFTRWKPEEDDDLMIQETSSYSFESRQYVNGQHDVMGNPPILQKSSRGTWMFYIIGFAVIAALAALYFVETNMDPFQEIEAEAQKAAKLEDD